MKSLKDLMYADMVKYISKTRGISSKVLAGAIADIAIEYLEETMAYHYGEALEFNKATLPIKDIFEETLKAAERATDKELQSKGIAVKVSKISPVEYKAKSYDSGSKGYGGK